MINDQFDTGQGGSGGGSVGLDGGPSAFSNDPWTDLPLIIMTDGNVTFNSGQLLTFQDPNSPDDDELFNVYTGGTNGFGRDGKTGDTIFNENDYIQRSTTYIDENGQEQVAQLKFFNTASTADYRFTSGVEYFQVITGFTMSELDDIFSQTSYQVYSEIILWRYIFNTQNTIKCNLFTENYHKNGYRIYVMTLQDFRQL